MALVDQKVLEARQKLLGQIQEKHPRAVLLIAPSAAGSPPSEYGGDVVGVVPPNRAQWRKFKVVGMDERKRPDALEILLRDCLVYPEAAELEALLERRPGLVETFSDQVLELAGAGLDVEKNV